MDLKIMALGFIAAIMLFVILAFIKMVATKKHNKNIKSKKIEVVSTTPSNSHTDDLTN